jgi:membrane-bound inhibitor of C-type lysozyme
MLKLRFTLATPLVALLASTATAAPVAFVCDDGQEITSDLATTGEAKVIRADKTWTLPATVTDSGTSYVADGVEFWTEGTEAILTVDGVTAQCILRPAAE